MGEILDRDIIADHGGLVVHSTLLKPHPWRVTKLPSITSFTKGKFHAIVRNMPWIQSLKVAAVLQACDGAPVNVDTILALIERNTELKRLEIDLNRYKYRSHRLTPSLILAIAKHPSLFMPVEVAMQYSKQDHGRCSPSIDTSAWTSGRALEKSL
ncbi:MAG: hypothetical protein BYD32DRAFT_466778 [Podila humilis]|nr:MAG: hypothetical protein BYD32DRAFT_466778 [Podila humilis]